MFDAENRNAENEIVTDLLEDEEDGTMEDASGTKIKHTDCYYYYTGI